MKKSFVSLLFLILISSCGRNAFLIADIRNIEGIEVNTGEIQLETSVDSLDFGLVSTDELSSKEIEIYNSGLTDINSMIIEDSENLSTDLSDCQNLKVRETCLATIELNSKGMLPGVYNKSLNIQLNNTDEYLQIKYEVEVLSEDIPDGELNFNFLSNKKINLGQAYINSEYKKLISLNSSGSSIRINKFNSTNSNEINLVIGDSASYCDEIFTDDCFVELVFTPKKPRKFKEQVSISYTDLTNNTNHTLKLDVLSKVKKRKDCFEYKEKSYSVKEQTELNQYEMALTYPYYNKSDSSDASLTSVLNTAFTQEIDIYGEILKFNQDTQVQFSYEVDADDSIVAAKLLLDLLKFEDVKNDSADTEILCNLDLQKCSGKRFVNRSYRKLINKDFKVINANFSKALTYNQKEWKFFTHKAEFKLRNYLGLEIEEFKKMSRTQSMSFVIADDVKLESKPILITSTKESIECK